MKNYYELLEVSQSASQEVIEKAYKTLTKKYHPDLQTSLDKTYAEQKMKELNEAYDVISNPEKRNAYNQELKKFEEEKLNQIQNDYQEIKQPNNNENDFNQINDTVQNNQVQDDYLKQQQLQFELEKRQAIEKAYHDAYIQDLKNRGYKIKYKKTFKQHLKNFVTILVIIFILLAVFQIPFIKNYFVNLYNENAIIKWIVDLPSYFINYIFSFISKK